MTKPVRLQLSRRAGFDLQRHSRDTNGLAAIAVARPSRWGNPFKVRPAWSDEYCHLPAIRAQDAVDLYRDHVERNAAQWPSVRAAFAGLHGHNLACWCAPGAPCHADVLLDLAARFACEDVKPEGEAA